MYLEWSEDAIHAKLEEILENDNGYMENRLILQQDGAPPHYAAVVRQYLDQMFSGQSIRRRGAIEWPPGSPDLSPLDFFFWGHFQHLLD